MFEMIYDDIENTCFMYHLRKSNVKPFFYPKSNSPFEFLHKLSKYLLPAKLGEGCLFRVQEPYLLSPLAL